MCTGKVLRAKNIMGNEMDQSLPSLCLHVTNWRYLQAMYHASALGHTKKTSLPGLYNLGKKNHTKIDNRTVADVGSDR